MNPKNIIILLLLSIVLISCGENEIKKEENNKSTEANIDINKLTDNESLKIIEANKIAAEEGKKIEEEADIKIKKLVKQIEDDIAIRKTNESEEDKIAREKINNTINEYMEQVQEDY